MGQTQFLSMAFLLIGVFSLGSVSIFEAYADDGKPSKTCRGKATIVGTNGIDIEIVRDSSEIYDMKGGSDTITDYDSQGYHDIFRTGKGDDTVVATNGNDTLCLGRGNDFAATVDSYSDFINCGSGNDTVHVDPSDIVSGNCETVIVIG